MLGNHYHRTISRISCIMKFLSLSLVLLHMFVAKMEKDEKTNVFLSAIYSISLWECGSRDGDVIYKNNHNINLMIYFIDIIYVHTTRRVCKSWERRDDEKKAPVHAVVVL